MLFLSYSALTSYLSDILGMPHISIGCTLIRVGVTNFLVNIKMTVANSIIILLSPLQFILYFFQRHSRARHE